MKLIFIVNQIRDIWSHPARGAWIEIRIGADISRAVVVAPRKGCVD